jgi:signal peptidase II
MAQRNRSLAALVIVVVVVLDFVTKRWALAALSDGTSFHLLGGLVPITLAFNQGAAFGLTIGNDPRWVFIPVTLVAMVFLLFLIKEARPGDYWRVGSAALILGGACGNLYDRLRWDGGVVDFVGPIDLGFMDWPIFNVADSAITCGAILLALSFLREEAASSRARREKVERGERGEGGIRRAGEAEAASEG